MKLLTSFGLIDVDFGDNECTILIDDKVYRVLTKEDHGGVGKMHMATSQTVNMLTEDSCFLLKVFQAQEQEKDNA